MFFCIDVGDVVEVGERVWLMFCECVECGVVEYDVCWDFLFLGGFGMLGV